MNIKRRNFLQNAGIVTAGALLMPQIACQSPVKDTSKEAKIVEPLMPSPSLNKFGIQLYTLRDVIQENPKEILKTLSTFGFNQIEGYEGKKGLFWGMTNTEFKKYTSDLGLNMVSSHCDINKDFEKKAAQAAEIGMEYLVCPWIGPQKSKDDWKKVTDKLNACGEICKKNGIRFAYHNHDYSFKSFSGMIPHNYMMDNTDPATVDFEMDIYWVVTGGADPIEYLEKYPNRFRLCHVKDRLKSAAPDEKKATCNLGTGQIDFPKILKVAQANGMKHYIMEQEDYQGASPMDSAKIGADYLKNLVFA